MTLDDIDAIMARQSELIAALDAQDAAAITLASEALAAAVATGRNRIDVRPDPALPERIGQALQQTNAAAMRTNTLLHWTRQRIGRIAELRGIPVSGRAVSY
jgi:hypothetical protein